MSEYTLTVKGNPIPAARMTQRSKWSKGARRSLAWQETVAYAWMEQTGNATLKGPVVIEMKFYRKTRHITDIDNLIKGTMDGIQYAGGFEKGDHQVWKIQAEKHIDKENPRVEMVAKESIVDTS